MPRPGQRFIGHEAVVEENSRKVRRREAVTGQLIKPQPRSLGQNGGFGGFALQQAPDGSQAPSKEKGLADVLFYNGRVRALGEEGGKRVVRNGFGLEDVVGMLIDCGDCVQFHEASPLKSGKPGLPASGMVQNTLLRITPV
jgi:hypothetical protein